jgi:cysteinyl-tRNA synthetase
MSAKHLGTTFDIHGGGQDLIFPHHENEIAQSTCGTDGKFARLWMHNGYVIVGGEKMSKSLGNFFTVRQLLEEGIRGEAIRLALLSGHYRQPLDVTREKIAESKAQLDRLYGALRPHGEIEVGEGRAGDALLMALEDDLNTPQAIAALHDWASALNKTADPRTHEAMKAALIGGGAVLGLLQQDPEDWFKGAVSDGLADDKIEALIAARTAARKAKDFAEADRIRDELAAEGVLLEDGSGGTTWKRG